MALLVCPECGKNVSEFASACPNCACPIEKIKVHKKFDVTKEEVGDESNLCWFCEKQKATQYYEHTFVDVQYANTTMMRKKRELSKAIKVPCCSNCKSALDSKSTYGFIFAFLGTILIIVPMDIWLYSINPGLLIMGIVFEITFVGALLLVFFYALGEWFWKITHKTIASRLKKDIAQHPANQDLKKYADSHPLKKPTLSEYLYIK